MKKVTVTLFISWLVSISVAQIERKATAKKELPAAAQNQEQPAKNEVGMKIKNKRLLQSLDLSKEERQKLKSIRRENREKKEAIENSDGLTAAERQQQLKLMHKGAADNIRNILTDEQKAKMKALRKEKKPQN
ncbi:MAG: hypothetical protein H7320_07320 [Ferruginibacter sp.]|nr:hypothetical protein [Ferruginibacter sp.]